MPLIKNGAIIADRYRLLGDDESASDGEPILVSLARWTKEREALTGRNAPIGVRLKSSEHPDALAQDLERLSLIAIEFPSFRDGRGFSYAYRLRAQYGFTGELRAFGHLLPDQAQFLIRCGFDSIAIKDNARLTDWQRGLSEFTVWYQGAADARESALMLRHRRAAAE